MWDSTRVHVLPCQMNPNPSWWARIWLAKRCSTCQWSAIVVCRFILHDMRWHANRIESLRSVPAPASWRSHEVSNFKLFTRLWSASRPQPRNSGWLAASPQKDLETAHATKFLMFLHVPHRSRIRVPHHRQGGKGFQNMVPDSFCPWRHGPTWSFPFGDHCLIVRSCARAIKLVAKIDKSMTRFQVAPWFVLLLFVGLTWRKGDTSS